MPPERPTQPESPHGARGILCPYCGSVSTADPRRCDRCGGHFDPLSRQATQNAMGPWFIRDVASPFRPGCSFETLRDLIRRGKINRETILRGPSTRQYWNFASRTPGIANLLGVCHNCHVPVRPDDFSCAACGAVFSPETDRQHMGLAPMHLLPGQASPEIIAAASMDPPPRAARPSKPLKPVPSVQPVLPVRRTGSRVPAITVAALIVTALGGLGFVRFVLPILQEPPLPARPQASPPSADKTPSPAAPEPAPPVTETPRPQPSESVPAAPQGQTEKPDLRLLLLQDSPGLTEAIARLRAAGSAQAAEAWEQLAAARAQQMRLRTLP